MKDIVYKVTDHYFELHDKTNQHPEPFALEGFRIKRYEPNKGSFPCILMLVIYKIAQGFLHYYFI